MKVLTTELPGVFIVEPEVHRDARGFFLESYHEERYREHGIEATFVQDNQSLSQRGTLRGLHSQHKHPQGKLLRVIEGEIFDVAVDIRHGAPSFGKFAAATLSAENFRQIFVPPGFAHGFCVLSEVAQVEYKCTDVYRPDDEISIAWDDPDLGIPWPMTNVSLSDKDRRAPRLAEMLDRLPRYEDWPDPEPRRRDP